MAPQFDIEYKIHIGEAPGIFASDYVITARNT